MRTGWMLGLAMGLGVGLSCGPGAFACNDDDQCQSGEFTGTCVAGYCAFPDEGCASGLAYGEHAAELSGTCVPPDSGGGSSGPSMTSVGASSATSTGSGPVDTGPVDSGPADSSDGPGPGEVVFTDDEFAGEFEDGTNDGTRWADDRLGLDARSTSGTFTSRVFDAEAVVQWQTLMWVPDGPYGKPLPDGGAAERGYTQGGVNMADNVLLMHMDGRGVWSDGTDVLDASGAGSHGTVISDGGPIELTDGVFGTAIDDHLASRISIPTDGADGLWFGEGDFTWSLWFRMDNACQQNHVYMGVDNNQDSGDLWPHLWLGCTDDQWEECSGTVDAPRGGGVLRSQHSTSGDGAFYCSDSAIDDGLWHHIAVTKQGHLDSTVRLYLDGQLEYEGAGSFAGPIEYPDAPDFTIGAFSRGTYPSEGVFDEAAIWSRSLSSQEIIAVYARGALSLSVSVRVCDEPECADEPAFATAYLDPAEALAPGSELPLSLSPGRYVQYQVRMARPAAGNTLGPALRQVTLRGMI